MLPTLSEVTGLNWSPPTADELYVKLAFTSGIVWFLKYSMLMSSRSRLLRAVLTSRRLSTARLTAACTSTACAWNAGSSLGSSRMLQ